MVRGSQFSEKVRRRSRLSEWPGRPPLPCLAWEVREKTQSNNNSQVHILIGSVGVATVSGGNTLGQVTRDWPRGNSEARGERRRERLVLQGKHVVGLG